MTNARSDLKLLANSPEPLDRFYYLSQKLKSGEEYLQSKYTEEAFKYFEDILKQMADITPKIQKKLGRKITPEEFASGEIVIIPRNGK